MERHPEYKYHIKRITREHSSIWLFIDDLEDTGWGHEIFDWTSDDQYTGPIELLNRIQEKERWTIKEVGDGQYCFIEDGHHMVFQMDDLFGLVLIVNNEKYEEVLQYLKMFLL